MIAKTDENRRKSLRGSWPDHCSCLRASGNGSDALNATEHFYEIDMEGHQMSFRYRSVVLGVATALCLSSTAFAGGPGEEETEEKPSATPAAEEASAEEEGFLGDWIPGTFSGSVGLVSDYSFRGISQTQTGFAAQGGVTWKQDCGFYLGTWASSVNYGQGIGDDSYLEQDYIVGFTKTWDAFTLDTNATWLWYPKESDLNYWELAVKGAYNVMDVATLKMNLVYSPDYFGILDNAVVFGGGVAVPLPITDKVALTVDANIENTWSDQFILGTQNNYLDWNAGLNIGLHKNFSVDLRYVDTDIGSVGGSTTDARFVGGVTFVF